MSAENSSSTAARGHELWSLREDVSLEGDPFRDPVRLHGRWGDITIPRSSQLVRETLYRMGLGPISLENATSAAAMPARGTYRDPAEVRAQVTELHSVLERLQPLIVRSLAQKSGQPLLSVVPLTMRSRFYPVPLAPGAPFRLSVYACLRADGREYSIESPLSLHRVVLHRTAAMRLIAPLASPITPAAFTAALSLAEPAAARVLEYLAAAGMVVGAQGAGNTSVFAEDLDTAVVGWSPVEMMFHVRSTLGRHDHNFGVTYPAGTTRPIEPVVKPQASRHIPLHTPRWEDLRLSDPPVVVAMEVRRSARRYAGSPITAAQLGDLLYRTARVRSLITAAPGGQDPPDVPARGTPYSNRPYPSGGACYELELYLTVSSCTGLANGVYHYDPLGHRLEPVSADRAAADELLSAACMTAALDSPAQVLISMTARFRRLSWRYEGLAYRLVLMHVGVLMQNLYIACAAMGLAPCALDAVDIDVAARAFGADWRTEPCVGQFLVGGQPDFNGAHRADRAHLSRMLLNIRRFWTVALSAIMMMSWKQTGRAGSAAGYSFPINLRSLSNGAGLPHLIGPVRPTLKRLAANSLKVLNTGWPAGTWPISSPRSRPWSQPSAGLLMKAARWRSRYATESASTAGPPSSGTGFATCWPARAPITSTWLTSGWAGPWRACLGCAGAR